MTDEQLIREAREEKMKAFAERLGMFARAIDAYGCENLDVTDTELYVLYVAALTTLEERGAQLADEHAANEAGYVENQALLARALAAEQERDRLALIVACVPHEQVKAITDSLARPTATGTFHLSQEWVDKATGPDAPESPSTIP